MHLSIVITMLVLLLVAILILLILCSRKHKDPGPDPPVESDWNSVMNEDFNSNSLDLNEWAINTSPDPTHGCSIYTDKHGTLSVADSNLVISLKQASNQGIYSGRIHSKRQVKPNSYVEAKIKMVNYSNFGWPAFWMVPKGGTGKYGGWPNSGEIDIMETVNNNGYNATTLHCRSDGDKCHGPRATNGISAGDKQKIDFSQYHTFGCKWYHDKITFHIDADGPDNANDSNKVGELTADKWKCCWENIGASSPAPFDGPMNIIINLAVGGDWASNVDGNNGRCKCGGHGCSDFSACSKCVEHGLDMNMKMMVDWVRVWEKK